MSQLIAALNLTDAVADNVLVVVVLLNLADDTNVNGVLHGLLTKLGKGGAVVVHPLLHLNEAGSVLDLVRGGSTAFIGAADGTNEFDLMQLATVGEGVGAIAVDGGLGIQNHTDCDGDESLLIVGLAWAAAGTILTAKAPTTPTAVGIATSTAVIVVEPRSLEQENEVQKEDVRGGRVPVGGVCVEC